MHFVSFGFEPIKVALHAIPTSVVPDFRQGLTGAAFAVDDPVLVGLRQIFERAVQVDVVATRVADEVGLAFLRHAALKRAHHALGEGARPVGDNALPVKADDTSEAAAFRAGAERMVEAEEPRGGWPDIQIAPGAVPSGGERVTFVGSGVDEKNAPFAEAQGGFNGFGQACFVRGGEAVLNDVNHGRKGFGRGLVDAESFFSEPDAEVTLLLEEFEKLRGRAFFDIAGANRKGDKKGLSGEAPHGLADDVAGRLGPDRLMTLRAGGGGEAGKEEFDVVIDFRDGADGRAGGFDAVRLLDGDSGRDAFDRVDAWFVHAVEELARVG